MWNTNLRSPLHIRRHKISSADDLASRRDVCARMDFSVSCRGLVARGALVGVPALPGKRSRRGAGVAVPGTPKPSRATIAPQGTNLLEPECARPSVS